VEENLGPWLLMQAVMILSIAKRNEAMNLSELTLFRHTGYGERWMIVSSV
jgi:hypothetical protein